MKRTEHDGKVRTYVTGPVTKKLRAMEEILAAEAEAKRTGRMPNRHWKRWFARWKMK